MKCKFTLKFSKPCIFRRVRTTAINFRMEQPTCIMGFMK